MQKKIKRTPLLPVKDEQGDIIVRLGVKSEDAGRDVLRTLARLIYTTSQEKMTIPLLLEHPAFSHLSYKTLENWAGKDGWYQARKEYLKRIELNLQQRLLDEHIKSEVEQLKELDYISNILKDKIQRNEAPPKSLEGLALAWDRITRLRIDVREKIKGMIEPEINRSISGNQNIKTTRNYDPVAMRKAAIEIIKAQQKVDKEKDEG